MEDLEFADRYKEGDIYIPVEQLARIINVNEPCLSLDGSIGQKGRLPEAVFYCPILPQTGRATGKSSLTNTLITGSTAVREAIPPHFQFSTKVHTVETEKLRVKLVACIPHVHGNFGALEEQAWPITIWMNARGGMDDVDFDEYLSN